MRHIFLFFSIALFTPVFAGDVYQEPDDFISEVFAGKQAEIRVIWLDKTLQEKVATILDHPYRGLRVRYWIDGTRTAWILDETGKEKPITTGFVINNNKIELVRILAFRESRGWEVKHAFFTRQFEAASLNQDNNLDRSIDNISGATLSVRAVTKLARVALLLHHKATTNGTP